MGFFEFTSYGIYYRGISVSRAFASHAVDSDSIPGRDRPRPLKQVVTSPLATVVSVTGPER